MKHHYGKNKGETCSQRPEAAMYACNLEKVRKFSNYRGQMHSQQSMTEAVNCFGLDTLKARRADSILKPLSSTYTKLMLQSTITISLPATLCAQVRVSLMGK